MNPFEIRKWRIPKGPKHKMLIIFLEAEYEALKYLADVHGNKFGATGIVREALDYFTRRNPKIRQHLRNFRTGEWKPMRERDYIEKGDDTNEPEPLPELTGEQILESILEPLDMDFVGIYEDALKGRTYRHGAITRGRIRKRRVRPKAPPPEQISGNPPN
jgi:hypothetical protein